MNKRNLKLRKLTKLIYNEQFVSIVALGFLLMTILYLHNYTQKSEKVDENSLKIDDSMNETFSTESDDMYLSEIDFVQEVESFQKSEVKENETEEKEVEIPPRQIKAIATAYTAFCDTGCIGITKTGYNVKQTVYHKDRRIIAVDPRVIPLYSIVEVTYDDESFVAIALDTGGAIKNRKIDILMKTKKRAITFGKREVTITVLREGKGES